MAESGLTVSSVVMTIIAVAIGVVMIGSFLAPTAAEVIADLSDSAKYPDGASWGSLVGLTVIISILGLIIVAVNSYSKK